MKKWALLLCALLLSGCKVDHAKIQNSITDELIKMTENEPIYYTTMEKPLYSYYLPKDVGRISSNELSSLFVKDGVKFIMNFNPNKVVIHDYYYKDKVITSEELISVDSENVEKSLVNRLESLGNKQNCIYIFELDKNINSLHFPLPPVEVLPASWYSPKVQLDFGRRPRKWLTTRKNRKERNYTA